MSHNIFGERFATLRQPAWHALGHVREEEESAMEVLRVIGGDVVTSMEPIFVKVPGSGGRNTYQELTDHRVVLRHPTEDDPEYVPFNIVSGSYQPITMTDVATVCDEFVAEPVETMGILGRGERGFVTFKLPEIDVKGDEVEMYLGATYSFVGAASVEVWPLRVVCANTLRLAQARAVSSYQVVHDSTARERMGSWLADAYNEAASKTAALKDLFTALAGAKATAPKAKDVISAAYPLPPEPLPNAPRDVIERRRERFEKRKVRVERLRTEAFRLYDGDGTGADSRAFKGTYWGVYNSVVETENYRRGSFRGRNGEDGGEAAEAVNSAENVMFGKRANAMERAAERALELVG